MSPDYEELQKQIAALTRRVYELEQRLGLHETITRNPRKPELATASTSKSEVESRIGGQWLNRIGIVAVFVGVSYFLKYAFDSGWIGPTGRVAIGLIAGIAVVLWSEPQAFETCTQNDVFLVNAAGVNVWKFAPRTGFDMSPDDPSYHWKENGGVPLA